MTKFEFSDAFKELFDVFSATNEDKKIRGYFEYFETKKASVFTQCVKQWIQRKPRFPSVAELLELYEMLNVENGFSGCSVCSGSGWVYPKGKSGVMRANCVHGERLSKSAGDVWFGEIKSTGEANLSQNDIDVRWAKDIMRNPKMFVAGYKYLAPMFYRQNRPLYDRIETLAKEVLGPIHFDKLWLNSKTFEQKTKSF